MKDEYLSRFYGEICRELGENYKIVIERESSIVSNWIEYDCVKWEMEKPIEEFVKKIMQDKTISLEEQIIMVYEFICLNYIYDANVLYFFRKDCSDPTNIKYIPVDWYGRVVGKEWTEKRSRHNRRICYEFSRFYAKAINTLIGKNNELEAVVVGDIENTHYVVGLTGKNYSIILDQDDFNGIKDLTRLKMGLTINGIKILRDENSEFEKALNKFNENKNTELPIVENENNYQNDIEYFNQVINAINEYNIDSQGFFEYVRAIIEKKGINIEKIWKEDTKNPERRYERCLYFKLEDKTYLLDSISKTLTEVNIKELDREVYIFNPEENEYKYYGG